MSTLVTQMPERPSVDTEIGRRVFHLMWDRKITQTDMGRIVGVGQSTLSKKLRGERPWFADELRAAAAALETTVGYLFGETENPHPGAGGGSSLPGLDSNQEPAGFKPIVSLADRRARRKATA
ncbi:MAG TPA: helix-turn-helix domain-containing protein [Terrimesophilobacter sp.]|nr:helix-turn-helix domain-containing protein [Terrimesophilobacter sp.]